MAMTAEREFAGHSTSEETSGFRLSEAHMEEYLDQLEQSGYTSVSLQCYRRNLRYLYQFLDGDRSIRKGTLAAWQESLLESGYSVSTVNSCTAAANGLVQFFGHGELQADRLAETEELIQPELTRTEYLRMLSTAKALGKERAYLLIKIFGSTGLSLGDLERMTVEAVQDGKIPLPSGTVRIPDGLRKELMQFAKRENIHSGPMFLTRNGNPQDRTSISKMIKTLCRYAQVPEEKANPRCLKKLYLTTQAGIFGNLSLLAEQAYDRLLEKEQQIYGWESG